MTAYPFAAEARANLGEPLYRYLMGRPADAPEDFGDRNAEDLAHWRLVPRVLTGQMGVDINVSLAGHRFAGPLVVGAFAGDQLFHREGLKPLARVAKTLNLPMAISEETVTPLAELTALHDGCWLQLRGAGPLERIFALVDRAADAGAQGMIFTIFAATHSVQGLQPGAFSVGAEIARRGWSTIGAKGQGVDALPTFPAWGMAQMTAVVDHCRKRGLPTLLKGILHPKDAGLADQVGASGIITSNLGLRQSHRWVDAATRLPGLVAATGLPVLLDGGVRNGSDAVVACCLGARMSVLVKPLVTALAGGGEAAVQDHLSAALDQVRAVTAWLGAGDLSDLGADHLVSKGAFR